jgi:beta-galactosidase
MDPRIIEPFDDGWRFHPGDVPGAEQRAHPDADWRAVDLPHDWSIEGPFLQSHPSAGNGGYAPCGIGWYRKTFSLPDRPKPGKVFLEFDGVYMDCTVWVNQVLVGRHFYGYTGFSLDVTEVISHGSGPIVVAVRVDNSAQPGSRWYSGSGIYRHTRLVCTDGLHFANQGISTSSVFQSGVDARLNVRHNGGHLSGQRAALRGILLGDLVPA